MGLMKRFYTSGRSVRRTLDEIEADLPKDSPVLGMKASHCEACRLEGLSDEEIEADWEVVEKELAELARQDEAEFEKRKAQEE